MSDKKSILKGYVEITLTLTFEGDSNVECPEWWHEDEHAPDGKVACPDCGSEDISVTFSNNLTYHGVGIKVEDVGKFPTLDLSCSMCHWRCSERGDDAEDALRLWCRAENLGSHVKN